MGLSVVVGGQLGSEGKGKVALHFARQFGVSAAVKVSGTNAGHSVILPDGRKQIFRVLPSACVLPKVTCVMSAGCCFSVDLLLKEVNDMRLDPERLKINPNAGIITDNLGARKRVRDLLSVLALQALVQGW